MTAQRKDSWTVDTLRYIKGYILYFLSITHLSFSVTIVELAKPPAQCVTRGLRRQNSKMNKTASRLVSATTLVTG